MLLGAEWEPQAKGLEARLQAWLISTSEVQLRNTLIWSPFWKRSEHYPVRLPSWRESPHPLLESRW